MNSEGVLCPEQGVSTASSRDTEPCSPLTSSTCQESLLETQCSCFPAAKARTYRRVSWTVVVISILLVIILVVFSVVLAITLTEQRSCALASVAHCSAQCPHQWIGYEGKCYFFSKEKRNWTSSQAFCSVYNASLASIEQDEKDFVMQIKDEGTYWIGLRKMSDQSWVWPNGEKSVLKVTGGSDCVYLDNEASSSGCHAELPFICSKAAGCTDS